MTTSYCQWGVFRDTKSWNVDQIQAFSLAVQTLQDHLGLEKCRQHLKQCVAFNCLENYYNRCILGTEDKVNEYRRKCLCLRYAFKTFRTMVLVAGGVGFQNRGKQMKSNLQE